MPAPHPLASLHAGGTEGAALAERKLRRLLKAHGGDVRATAAALEPPVHETTLHDWIARWGLDDARRGPKKKTDGAKKDP
jgi:hypothetical protein